MSERARERDIETALAIVQQARADERWLPPQPHPLIVYRIAAALGIAREEGRESVGLGDFMIEHCDDEKRAPGHLDYAWLRCTRAPGHDGDHENEETGLTWSAR